MTEYRDLPTWKRMETKGEIAAGQFVAWVAYCGHAYRPNGVEHHPENGRYAPDFDVEGLGLVEVMSTGPDSVWRVKLEKLAGLAEYQPYRWWLYDPVERRCGLMNNGAVYSLVFEGKHGISYFQDGDVRRPYYYFRVEDLPIDWVPVQVFIESEWHRD